MMSILLKYRNDAPNIDINSGDRFNKTKINRHKPARPLSWKGEPFTRANLHEFLSDLIVDDDVYKNSDAGI